MFHLISLSLASLLSRFLIDYLSYVSLSPFLFFSLISTESDFVPVRAPLWDYRSNSNSSSLR
jgi:hypothetical protein